MCLYSCLMVSAFGSYADITPITIKFDPSATGSYQVTGINEFDWQSSGDMVIENQLPFPATASGSNYNTFQNWIANASLFDTVVVQLYVHARLNDLLDNNGNSIRPNTLSRDGATCDAGANCFEITAASNLQTSAVLIGQSPNTLLFTAVDGSYAFLLDSTPDSDVATGSGFTNGVVFLTGNHTNITGSFAETGSGSSVTGGSVASYVSDIIEAEGSGYFITNTTFDSLHSSISAGEAAVGIGDTIGLGPYVVQVNDLVFKSDSNSEFLGDVTQEIAGCRMTGGGVDDSGNIILDTVATSGKWTFGGNIRSGLPNDPEPGMNWQHNQHGNRNQSFSFHVGTPSAPPETKITKVECFDEGFCFPARPADFQQIKWTGIGSFRMAGREWLDLGVIPSSETNYTLHCIEGHVVDMGEPGAGGANGPQKNKSCPFTPDDFFAEPPAIVDETATDPSQCGNCADYYSFTIYDNSSIDPDTGQCAGTPIYQVYDFIDGGDLQLHPLNP